MKIRTDFVTNSSSVSYILTMCEDMVETDIKLHDIAERDPKAYRIIKLLKDDLLKNGTCVFLEGKEIYTKRVKVRTEETMDDDAFDKPVEEIDFVKMPVDELWAYIFGEYIYKGKLNNISGFGLTKIDQTF